MEFKDLFREKYRAALLAARAGNKQGVIDSLRDLYSIFAEQYRKENGDPIVIKAKLSRWQDILGGYIGIVQAHGLSDPRIRKFFGLSNDISLPSLGDLLGGASFPSDERGGVPDIVDLTPSETGGGESVVAENPMAGSPMPQTPAEQPPEEGEAGEGLDEPKEEFPELPMGEVGETLAPPVYEPDSLEHFIGQQHIVKVLLKEIAIAKAEGKHHLDNILLFGNPGLGKSTLMRLIAKSLGVRFEWMDCSQYRNSQQSLKALQNFLMRVARENEPVVIAFDEVHMLTDELQSSLLTLLESRVYVSPPDVNGNVKRIPIEEFTFIAATTDDDKVLNTIKDRCLRLKFQMVDYTADELRQIYRTKVAAKGLTITEEAIATCIPRSRGSIRYVNSFVEGLDRELYDDSGKRTSTHIDLAVAQRFFEEMGIDPIGLGKKDLEILRTIGEEASGVIGAETLSARVGLDPKKYLSEYEPYLVKIKFISVTGRGRSLTEQAIEYLKKAE